MAGCAKCGTKLDAVGAAVGRRDVCSKCGADLHACVQCRHYDVTVAKDCKEPFAEVPQDKESANFCDLFQLGQGGQGGLQDRTSHLTAAEALFRKR